MRATRTLRMRHPAAGPPTRAGRSRPAGSPAAGPARSSAGRPPFGARRAFPGQDVDRAAGLDDREPLALSGADLQRVAVAEAVEDRMLDARSGPHREQLDPRAGDEAAHHPRPGRPAEARPAPVPARAPPTEPAAAPPWDRRPAATTPTRRPRPPGQACSCDLHALAPDGAHDHAELCFDPGECSAGAPSQALPQPRLPALSARSVRSAPCGRRPARPDAARSARSAGRSARRSASARDRRPRSPARRRERRPRRSAAGPSRPPGCRPRCR